MQPAELSLEVQALLRERIESYEALHVLLLLFQERAAWHAAGIAARLQLRESAALTALDVLARHGLIAAADGYPSEPHYRYAPGAQDDAVASLARAYYDQPIVVMRLMAANAIERIRAEALRAFADAFLFRKDK